MCAVSGLRPTTAWRSVEVIANMRKGLERLIELIYQYSVHPGSDQYPSNMQIESTDLLCLGLMRGTAVELSALTLAYSAGSTE